MAFILSYYAGEAVSSLGGILFCAITNPGRFYNAHETTAVEEVSIALLCGDVRCDVSSLLV